MALTKVSYAMIQGDPVNVLDFGAVGDGSVDDTAAIQAAINTGFSVFIPNGTYKTTSPLNVTTNNQQITGGGNTKIVGAYEQDSVSPNADESMIFVDGADNVTIKNITLQYTGTFSPGGPTVSYGGYVSCIQVEDCDDFTAENVIAYGANRCGINVGYMLTGTPPYCARPKILNCYLHHNRVGGITLGNTNEAIVRGCSLTFNGNDPDGGTGYGFATWAACEPIDTLVDGNQANDNYRKGIDFHAGLNGVVSNNVCARNRIYGIYVMSNRGAFTISNNLITEMTGPNAFGFAIYGIRVGGLVGQGLSEIPTSYVLDGNVINEFNLTSGDDGFPLGDVMAGCSYGRLLVTNNIVDVGTVGQLHNGANGPSVGLAGNYYDVTFSNNQMYATSCSSASPPIYIRGSNNRQKIFNNNNIVIDAVNTTAGIVTHDSTLITNRCFIANGNNITAPASGWSVSATDPIAIRKVSTEKMIGNVTNQEAWRDWDGYKYIFFTNATAPTTDTWTRGSIVWKNNVSALGTPGYMCVTAGTPGTWSAMASLV